MIEPAMKFDLKVSAIKHRHKRLCKPNRQLRRECSQRGVSFGRKLK